MPPVQQGQQPAPVRQLRHDGQCRYPATPHQLTRPRAPPGASARPQVRDTEGVPRPHPLRQQVPCQYFATTSPAPSAASPSPQAVIRSSVAPATEPSRSAAVVSAVVVSAVVVSAEEVLAVVVSAVIVSCSSKCQQQ